MYTHAWTHSHTHVHTRARIHTVDVESGQYIVDALHLPEGGAACGEGQGAYPGVPLVQRRGPTPEEDALIVAGGPQEDGTRLPKQRRPALQQILNVLHAHTHTHSVGFTRVV